jgi:hypothetical protein
MARRLVALGFSMAAHALAPPTMAQYDPPPPPGTLTVNINNVSAGEGNSGTTQAVFTVSLSMAAESAVTADYVMPAEGNATPGVDYQVVSGTVTIPAGMMSATVAVPIQGDTLDEPDEGFVVHLASATGATIDKHHGLGTIVDDDGGTIADTAPPNTMIHGGPNRVTRSRTARFHLMSTEPGSKFQCKLDAGAWRPCGAYKTYRNLKKGLHTLRVRAIDAAGNRDPTPARRTWRIR